MKRKAGNDTEAIKTGRIDAAMRRYDLGRDSMRRLAKMAEAEIKIGRAYLINFDRVDAFLEERSH